MSVSAGARVAMALVRVYQLTLSPLFTGSCRFEPSCSRYAMTALEQHGLYKGAWLAIRRLARCHPLGGSGLDPVPPPRLR